MEKSAGFSVEVAGVLIYIQKLAYLLTFRALHGPCMDLVRCGSLDPRPVWPEGFGNQTTNNRYP